MAAIGRIVTCCSLRTTLRISSAGVPKPVSFTRSKCIGPPHSRTELYAARASYAADDAHRPPLHCSAAAARALLLPRALFLGQTDGRTQHRFNPVTAYAVQVIMTLRPTLCAAFVESHRKLDARQGLLAAHPLISFAAC